MTLKSGDLVAIPFPYSDMVTTKRRPVLIVTNPDRHGDFMALAVTSVTTRESAMTIDNEDMARGKLPKRSWVRYDKLFTLSSTIVTKKYGSLKPESLQPIIDAFVKSRKCSFSVIPAKAGIQCYQALRKALDPVFQRGDDFLRDRHN